MPPESRNAMNRVRLSRRWVPIVVVGLAVAALNGQDRPPPWTSGIEWPEPKIVDPGPPGGPPSDAILLFDGKDLAKEWHGAEHWTVRDGYAVAGGGGITTRRSFGDCQIHIEWASPAEVRGDGQGRGNSGVFLMGHYEIQILDSYENETYYDGQGASIYKQRPPLVNASRPPGEWQTYDIIFRAPRFSDDGELLEPAYVTLLHNGVVVLNYFEILGRTAYRRPPTYEPHDAKGPIHLQYHGSPVRFRNMWVRELEDEREDLLKPLRERLKQAQ